MDLTGFFPYKTLTAGDTWEWTLTVPNYLASAGWSVTYVAKAQGQTATVITSTPSGDSHKILVDPEDTATFLDGLWSWSVSLVNTDGTKKTLATQQICIKPDLATVSDDFDPRSHNQKCYDALQAVLYEGADRVVLEEVFKDYTVKYRSNVELLRLLNYYKIQVDSENGIKSGRIIYNRV